MDGEPRRGIEGRIGRVLIWLVFVLAVVSMFGDALEAEAWSAQLPATVREPQCVRTTDAVTTDPTDRKAVERWWFLRCDELGLELPNNASR